jgi:F-type H+-transporting ATPase subunit b
MLQTRKSTIRNSGLTVVVCIAIIGFTVAGFASEGGEGAHHVDTAKQMKDFVWRCIDFGALFALMFWAIKKADVKGSLAARRAGIEKMLQEAVEAKEQAEKKFSEYSAKLDKANKEIEEMSLAMRQEGELEKVRIIAEAKASADKIREQAELAAAQEVLKARTELRAEAARLAVELAEKKIKENIVKNDQDKLVADYITKVVTLH